MRELERRSAHGKVAGSWCRTAVRQDIRRRWGCALTLAVTPLLLSAQTAVPGPIERMKAGDALMAPAIAPAGPVMLLISLPLQRAIVYRNGVPIAASTISTGKRRHRTPTGIFTILQKDVDHRSNKYDDAPMPYMQRLTWDGVALHAGQLPGYPASHGCIRLPYDFAKWLFSITRPGVTVIVTKAATLPEIAPSTAPLATPEPSARLVDDSYFWHPEKALTGPVSLVLSGRDRRIVVLRNGVRIGEARALLDRPVATTAAYALQSVDAAGPHWIRLPLPGLQDESDRSGGGRDPINAQLPDAFRIEMMKLLEPGATLLITRDTLASTGVGTRLSLLDADRDDAALP